MSGVNLRKEVLKCYKSLLKTRKLVFAGDEVALVFTLNKIREEFRKHKSETNQDEIRKLIQIGIDAEKILRNDVIQAELNQKGNYGKWNTLLKKLKLRKDIFKDSTNSPKNCGCN